METVAVVRHPIDWLSSWYRYRHRDELVGQPNSTRGITFDDFVLEFTKDKPASFAAVGAQSKFLLRRSDKKIGVTHLFSYERQSTMLAFFEERLSIKINLNRVNVSPVMETPLSRDVEDVLRSKRAIEFDVWEMAKT
jgi:hypothetical protein